MGRIKSTLIKRTAKQLLNEKDMFTISFEHNKKILGRTMPSKKMRNRIAGHMAHIVQMKEQKAKEPEKKQIPQETPEYILDQAQF
jgi:ribosomal protein S17E